MKIHLTCSICKKVFVKELRHYNKLKDKNRATCSYKCMGKMRSQWTNGENNSFYGKNHTAITKNILKQKAIGRPGYFKGKKLSKETRDKISKNHANMSGKNNPMYGVHRYGKDSPNWCNGVSKLKYPAIFVLVRKEILKRDNYVCQECKLTSEESKIKYNKDLEVHHIDYNKENVGVFNLITLCRKCNTQANSNRLEKQKYYFIKVCKQNNNFKVILHRNKQRRLTKYTLETCEYAT